MTDLLQTLGIENNWQLIVTLSVLLAHMRVMWQRTKEANVNLMKFGKLADVLLKEDPHARIPNTVYITSLIDKFHDSRDELGEVHSKVDRILEHLDVPGTGLAKRRIGHD